MNTLRPTLASQYSPTPLQPLAPTSTPARTEGTQFPVSLGPGTVRTADIEALERFAQEHSAALAETIDHSVIASTAAAALRGETLPLSRTQGEDKRQAQYGINVLNPDKTPLGRLTIDVKPGAQGGYELVAALFTPVGSSTPMGFTRDAHGTLQKNLGRAAQRASLGDKQARARTLVSPKKLIEARSNFTMVNRGYLFSNEDLAHQVGQAD
ncbi:MULTISPECIES: hypothetical protein [Pseudomonas]|uniref:Uncharacterized protein n=1 Tax=Pseudomonas quercus TaxID=2722792 RepID=A0ABX0YA03_9PSED|nr:MULTISPECIES: hypothetical protein [Pseudomonas]MBF7141264.1 hypothetical protein [Pseudomonas sp. LY10J]NJO99799.1 hypothetical protein [Pseudomonas quercus]